jgi:hypothetical protein
MDSGNSDSLPTQGRLSMRVLFGIAIALPVAAVFCLSYLILFALETLREATRSRGARSAPLAKEPWISPARIAV